MDSRAHEPSYPFLQNDSMCRRPSLTYPWRSNKCFLVTKAYKKDEQGYELVMALGEKKTYLVVIREGDD